MSPASNVCVLLFMLILHHIEKLWFAVWIHKAGESNCWDIASAEVHAPCFAYAEEFLFSRFDRNRFANPSHTLPIIMGKFYDSIPADLVDWVMKQQVFWVATAPLSPDGHVNVSPKGLHGSFHIVNETRVWYQDLTGSGSETIAHLKENGRITILFSAFDGPPRIVRFFGTGNVHEFGTPEYDELIPVSLRMPGSRGAVVIDVHKVGTSCGYGVPLYDFVGHRPTLVTWLNGLETKEQRFASAIGEEARAPGTSGAPGALKAYWALKNTKSIDGLPAFTGAYVASAVPVAGIPPEVACANADPEKRRIEAHLATDGAIRIRMPLRTRDEVCLVVGFAIGIIVAATYARLLGAC